MLRGRLALLIVASFVGGGCIPDFPCATDEDCTGARVCVDEVCQEPSERDVGTSGSMDLGQDTGNRRDQGAEDQGALDLGEADQGAEDRGTDLGEAPDVGIDAGVDMGVVDTGIPDGGPGMSDMGPSDPDLGTPTPDMGSMPVCDNGSVEMGEICDGTDFDGVTCSSTTAGALTQGMLACADACSRIDVSGCHQCGNTTVEGSERCEPTDLQGQSCLSLTGLSQGQLGCQSDCLEFDTSGCFQCGDGMLDANENCDDGNTTSGDGCSGTTCQAEPGWTCSVASPPNVPSVCQRCGNGIREGNETCDGNDFGGETCSSLTGGQLTQGMLSCSADCSTIDAGQCYQCGNGSVEGPEECDGTDFDGESCSIQTAGSLPEGSLTCVGGCLQISAASCSNCGNGTREGAEVCDGQDFGLQTCTNQTQGLLTQGALNCTNNCTVVDPGQCYQCGNGTVEGAESCETTDLDGQTCNTVAGHTDGALGCNTGCLTFDSSDCHSCGNGLIEGPEVCDGPNLGSPPETCDSQYGLSQGTLGCGMDCRDFDPGQCFDCGNQTAEGPEECDGSDLRGMDCTDFGRPSGFLACDPSCTVNLSLCAQCGNGTCETGLGEDTQNCPGDCGWVEMSLGAGWGCGIRMDGTAHCWGTDSNRGRLGKGTIGDCPVDTACPLAVAPALTWSQISVSAFSGCALESGGTVYCWGYNAEYQLGTGLNTPTMDATPATIALAQGLLGTIMGGAHGAAIGTSGSVYTWGFGFNSVLGRTTGGQAPDLVPGVGGVVEFSTGADALCALHANGSVTCWGRSDAGQAGPNAPTGTGAQTLPVDVGISDVTQLSGGVAHVCGLKSDQSVHCWGFNNVGQLGRAPVGGSSSLPLAVTGLSTVVEIASCYAAVCARKADGTVHCWGQGVHGQLGDGLTTDREVPLPVPGISNATRIYSGPTSNSFCASLANGDVSCWGQDFGSTPTLFAPR